MKTNEVEYVEGKKEETQNQGGWWEPVKRRWRKEGCLLCRHIKPREEVQDGEPLGLPGDLLLERHGAHALDVLIAIWSLVLRPDVDPLYLQRHI